MKFDLDLTEISDDELFECMVDTAEHHRGVTVFKLKQMIEAQRRHLYSKYDCSNLRTFCVKKLKMDSGEAGRSISAAKLLSEMPSLEEKLLNGKIELTSVSDASVFFRKEKRAGNEFAHAQKEQIVDQLAGKTTRAVAQVLIAHSTTPEIHFRDSITQKTATHVEAKIHLDEEAMRYLNRIQEIWSHAMPHATFSDLVKRSLKESVEKHDPLEKARRSESRARNAEKTSRAIPTPDIDATTAHRGENPAQDFSATSAPKPVLVRHQVRLRDEDRCTFTDPKTGARCNASHFVEEDHIIPKAMGGAYTVENIRLRCRAHNQRHAINTYGWQKMTAHLTH